MYFYLFRNQYETIVFVYYNSILVYIFPIKNNL